MPNDFIQIQIGSIDRGTYCLDTIFYSVYVS